MQQPGQDLDKSSISFLVQQVASLLLYRSILDDEVGQAFVALLQTLDRTTNNPAEALSCLQAYSRWFYALASCHQSWQTYLQNQILRSTNPFAQHVQQFGFAKLPPALIAAARHDLHVLQELEQCNSQQLSQWVQMVTHSPSTPIVWELEETIEPEFPFHHYSNWADAIEALAEHYRKFGSGLFAKYRALRWQAGQFMGISHPDPVQLNDLVGYDWQKEALLKNTEFLLKGYPALHVLLYGSRGSGKSSLVKALLNHYADRSLRLVEVAKADLTDLPTIAEQLRSLPQKFILFVDDLSFEEDEDTYKALKVVLEGNVAARPQNIVVYATSNRRHLIREFFGDRPRPSDGDEVHAWDTVQEKLSFSDRFGLTLTFEPANQKTYLEIIHHLAAQASLAITPEDLEHRALQWATRHNGRSGRTARQFIDFLKAELTS